MKWAQHIAEGRPLDFSQKQINDFGYSLILDIADIANGGSLCNTSTEPDHHSVECYGLSKDSVIDTNSSCTSLKGKAQKTHYPSDLDSDFESPKKRPQKDPESNSHITPCKTTASHIDDHTYAKDADQADSSRSHQITQSVQNVLPTGYQYSCHELREIPSQNFTGAHQENFYVKLSVCKITTKEEVNQWLQQFTTSSNIKYNAQGGYKRKGVKVIYARWYICQCKRKKITKKQVAAKEAALKRNEKRHRTHKTTETRKDASYTCYQKQGKKTDCDSKMSTRINRKKVPVCHFCVKQSFGGTTITVWIAII